MNDEERKSVRNKTPAPSKKIVIKDAYSNSDSQNRDRDRVNFRKSLTRLTAANITLPAQESTSARTQSSVLIRKPTNQEMIVPQY